MIIVTLTKNSEKTIKDTINSINKNSLKKIKWIIFDDNSKDNTCNFINRFSKIDFKIIKIKSLGLFNAYNIALNYISSNFKDDVVFFLHSDDILYDEKILERVQKLFDTKLNIDIIFGNIVFFKNDQKSIFRYWDSYKKNFFDKLEDNLFLLKSFKMNYLYLGWCPPHTSFFFRTNIINELPYYNENYKVCGDFDWLLNLLTSSKIKLYFLRENVIKMRTGGISTRPINFFNILKYDFIIIKNRLKFKKFKIILSLVILLMKKISKISQFFLSK